MDSLLGSNASCLIFLVPKLRCSVPGVTEAELHPLTMPIFTLIRYILQLVDNNTAPLIKSYFSGFLENLFPPPFFSRIHFSASELHMRVKNRVLLTWLVPSWLWALCGQNRTLSHNLEEDLDLQPAAEAINLTPQRLLLPLRTFLFAFQHKYWVLTEERWSGWCQNKGEGT